MNSEQMKLLTKKFAIDVGRLVQQLPNNVINKAYCSQIIRASSSVAANYRATRRAKSKADFINKFKIVEEELDESLFFLELIEEFNEQWAAPCRKIYDEGDRLLRIVVATLKSLRIT
jgi:four helix bundle protein